MGSFGLRWEKRNARSGFTNFPWSHNIRTASPFPHPLFFNVVDLRCQPKTRGSLRPFLLDIREQTRSTVERSCGQPFPPLQMTASCSYFVPPIERLHVLPNRHNHTAHIVQRLEAFFGHVFEQLLLLLLTCHRTIQPTNAT